MFIKAFARYNSSIIICTTLRFSLQHELTDKLCTWMPDKRLYFSSFFILQPLHTSFTRAKRRVYNHGCCPIFYAIQCRHWKIIAFCHQRCVIIIYKIEYFGDNVQICTTEKLYIHRLVYICIYTYIRLYT